MDRRDGHPLSDPSGEISPWSLQDVFLFSRTIAENVALRPDFNEDKLAQALNISHCNKFVGS